MNHVCHAAIVRDELVAGRDSCGDDRRLEDDDGGVGSCSGAPAPTDRGVLVPASMIAYHRAQTLIVPERRHGAPLRRAVRQHPRSRSA